MQIATYCIYYTLSLCTLQDFLPGDNYHSGHQALRNNKPANFPSSPSAPNPLPPFPWRNYLRSMSRHFSLGVVDRRRCHALVYLHWDRLLRASRRAGPLLWHTHEHDRNNGKVATWSLSAGRNRLIWREDPNLWNNAPATTGGSE